MRTTVKASYKGGTLAAYYEPDEIDGILRRIDGLATENSMDRRADARQFVIDTMRRNGHHLPGKPEAQFCAHTLLWLACRSEAGDAVLAAARAGGYVIEYQITVRKPHANFRLIVREGCDLDFENMASEAMQ